MSRQQKLSRLGFLIGWRQRILPELAKNRWNFPENGAQAGTVLPGDVIHLPDWGAQNGFDKGTAFGKTIAIRVPGIGPVSKKSGTCLRVFPEQAPVVQSREIMCRKIFHIRAGMKQFRCGRPIVHVRDPEAHPASAWEQANPRQLERPLAGDHRPFLRPVTAIPREVHAIPPRASS